MIVCDNCETSQFLQIISSRSYYSNGEDIEEITEEYECTLCKSTGKYEWTEEDGPDVSGNVRLEDDQPRWPTPS